MLFHFDSKKKYNNSYQYFFFKVKQLNKFKLKYLQIGSAYVVKVKGINSTLEGIETELNFITPDCWEFPDANISVCRKFVAYCSLSNKIKIIFFAQLVHLLKI